MVIGMEMTTSQGAEADVSLASWAMHIIGRFSQNNLSVRGLAYYTKQLDLSF